MIILWSRRKLVTVKCRESKGLAPLGHVLLSLSPPVMAVTHRTMFFQERESGVLCYRKPEMKFTFPGFWQPSLNSTQGPEKSRLGEEWYIGKSSKSTAPKGREWQSILKVLISALPTLHNISQFFNSYSHYTLWWRWVDRHRREKK